MTFSTLLDLLKSSCNEIDCPGSETEQVNYKVTASPSVYPPSPFSLSRARVWLPSTDTHCH